jgi:hypothetical protein
LTQQKHWPLLPLQQQHGAPPTMRQCRRACLNSGCVLAELSETPGCSMDVALALHGGTALVRGSAVAPVGDCCSTATRRHAACS